MKQIRSDEKNIQKIHKLRKSWYIGQKLWPVSIYKQLLQVWKKI